MSRDDSSYSSSQSLPDTKQRANAKPDVSEVLPYNEDEVWQYHRVNVDPHDTFRLFIRGEKDEHQTLRNRLQRFLILTSFGLILVWSFFSSCVLWVYQTYLDTTTPLWFIWTEFGLAGFFIFDFLVRFLTAENRWLHMVHPFSIIDYVTVIPILLSFTLSPTVLSVFRALGTFRVFRILRICLRSTDGTYCRILTIYMENLAVKRQYFVLIASSISIIFVASGLITVTEASVTPQLKNFHTALYFIIVTSATVGYGDFTPVSEGGRLVVIILIVSAFILIPIQTNKLSSLARLTSEYDGSYKGKPSRRHVLLTGHITANTIREFLREFLKKEWVRSSFHFVILSGAKPDMQIKQLLLDSKYRSLLSYFTGNATSRADLRRVDVKGAYACIILTDLFSSVPNIQDKESLVQAIAVKQESSKCVVYVQVLNPSYKPFFKSAGIDNIFSINKFKLNLLAHNCLVPGGISLVAGLITGGENTEDKHDPSYHEQWANEYNEGKAFSIYSLIPPQCFVGKSVQEITLGCYFKYRAIALGVKKHGENAMSYAIHLFHANYLVGAEDSLFFIAHDEDTISLIRNSSEFPDVSFLQNAGGPTGDSDDQSHEDVPPIKIPRFKTKMLRDNLSRTVLTRSITSRASKYQYSKNIKKELLERYFIHERGIQPVSLVYETVLKLPFVSNHLIICTPSFNGLSALIAPLRVTYLGFVTPIVLLVPKVPSLVDSGQWSQIIMFKGIYVVQGLPENASDLKRAGIKKCKKIILLSPPSSETGQHGNQHPSATSSFWRANSADIENVMNFFNVAVLPSPVVPLLRSTQDFLNVKLLPCQITSLSETTPDESLVHKRFRSVWHRVNHFPPVKFFVSFFRQPNTPSSKNPVYPLTSAGRVVTSSLLERMLSQLFFNSDIVHLIKMMVYLEKSSLMALSQVPLPKKFLKQLSSASKPPTFSDLFLYCLSEKMVAIALYRTINKQNSTNISSDKSRVSPFVHYYVYTCPKHTTVLKKDDRVFVICDKHDLVGHLQPKASIVVTGQSISNISKISKGSQGGLKVSHPTPKKVTYQEMIISRSKTDMGTGSGFGTISSGSSRPAKSSDSPSLNTLRSSHPDLSKQVPSTPQASVLSWSSGESKSSSAQVPKSSEELSLVALHAKLDEILASIQQNNTNNQPNSSRKKFNLRRSSFDIIQEEEDEDELEEQEEEGDEEQENDDFEEYDIDGEEQEEIDEENEDGDSALTRRNFNGISTESELVEDEVDDEDSDPQTFDLKTIDLRQSHNPLLPKSINSATVGE